MIRDTSGQDRPIDNPRSRARRWLLPAAGALVLLALSAYATRGWLGGETSVDASRVRIATVQLGTLVRDLTVEGRVTAANSPTLYAVAAGTVDLAVVAGDAVTVGQVLAEIDSPELTSRLAQERATLQSLEIEAGRAELDVRQGAAAAQMKVDQAEIDRQTAARELERNQRGFDLGVVAEIDLLRARDNLRKAEVALEHAKRDAALQREGLQFDLRTQQQVVARQRALVSELERQVAALVIRSPVEGQVGQVLVAQRQNVAENEPILSVVDLSAFEVEFQVPESFARDLGIGMPAEIHTTGVTYAGEIRSVSPQVVNGEVVGRLRFVDGAPERLRQNQRLSARIVIEEIPETLLVERGPFLESSGGRYAWFVENGIAERRPLTTGAVSLDAVEILEGAEPGDRIVVSGVDAFGDAGSVRLAGL
ncbi:MAG TPA: HlyD family efflux transporter periplasmic adaptor subunit [Pseudomonadales bacterium]